MKIGDEVYIHGYIDEIRNDTVIIKNDGGYFGTVEPEVVLNQPEPRGDAVSREEAKWGVFCNCDHAKNQANAFDELSSAQPEQTRIFVELVVEYPDPELCTYKEYRGKPYYSIKYIENGEIYVGFGTYKPEVLSQYLKENFISSAQPDRSCIDQLKWERDIAIQQLNELGYSFGEAIRHDKDTVSRKGAINAVCTVLYPDADKMNDAKKVLKEMPSAQPEQRWIPCSGTIDIPDHEVLCCDRYGEELIGWLSYVDDQWLCESDGEMMYDPVAWREKPEPYRGEQE